MKKKKKKNKILILALLLIILLLSVGYALFSENLLVSGTANTSGEFDVEFTQAQVDSANTNNVSSPSAQISVDKNTVTLTAANMGAPGAKATYNITAKNVGSINAKLTNVAITGNTNPDLLVTTSNFTTGSVLEPNDTLEFFVAVEWPLASENGSQSITYSVTLEYEQET